jgi:hypothetical protein
MSERDIAPATLVTPFESELVGVGGAVFTGNKAQRSEP